MTHNPDIERAEPLFDDARSAAGNSSDLATPPSQLTPIPDPASVHERRFPRRRFAGPGGLESLGWAAMMLVLQVVVSVGFTGLAMLMSLAEGTGPLASPPAPVEATAPAGEQPPPPATVSPAEQLMRRIQPQMKRLMPWMFGVVGLVNCLFALALCRFRLGNLEFHHLGWQLPSIQHVFLLLLLFIPLSICCSSLQGWAAQLFPESGRELAELFGSLRHLPLPLLMLVLAVAPAIGEELVFRGVIGRGLLARQGWIWGIAVTSVMFAGVHLSPAQVIGVLPLGIVIHLVYAATRSFWAPMLAHFLNNGLASVMIKLSDSTLAESAEATGETFDLRLIGLSAIALVFLGSWLWTTRVRFVSPEGVEWNPAEADCGIPARDSEFHRETTPPRAWQVAGALAAVAALLWVGLQSN
jgi:membrane protease YdiL (CAAX protease family)